MTSGTTGTPESGAPESSPVTGDEARHAAAAAEAAQARAETARARAEELRRRVRDASKPADAAEPPKPADAAEPPKPADAAEPPKPAGPPAVPADSPVAAPAPARRLLIGVAVAALLATALLGATGYMVWRHHESDRQRLLAAEYVAAARQGIVNLMSIDHNTAQDSAQRVLDGSTGNFHDNFAQASDDFVKALTDEKISTFATVNAAAVESMSADSAVVLISATSRREGEKAPPDQQQPRRWRIVLNLKREGGQIKMSGVQFG